MFRRMITAVLFSALLLAPAQLTRASQGNLVLPTTGLYNAIQFSSLITEAISALNTCNSGATEPANAAGAAPAAGQCWDDTSTNPVSRKIFDGASWLPVAWFDTTTHTWMPSIGGGTASLASAATVDLCSVPQSYITITGTTTITSLGASTCRNGSVKVIRFAGALTLTHEGATLSINGAENITTVAGDMAIAVRATSTRWDVLYPRSVAAAPPASADATPIGTMLTYGGFSPPTGYQWCAGSQISRASFPDYLAAVTYTDNTVIRQNGQPTLTSWTITEQFRVGMDLEGEGIPAGATIISKTVNTVTMSANATSSGTSPVTVFAWGNGNGSSTVNLPDVRGRVLAGRDDMNGNAAGRLTASAPTTCAATGLGQPCGAEQGTLTEAQLPSVSKNVNISVSGTTGNDGAHQHFVVAGGGSTAELLSTNTLAELESHGGASEGYTLAGKVTGANRGLSSSAANHNHTFSDSGSDTVAFGSGAAHSRLQPTLVTNCIVKIQ